MTAEAQFFFDWEITKLESKARVGDYTDVVTRVFWTLWGSDEFGNSAPLYGETEIPTEISEDDFIPYGSLTKNEVEDMLENTLGEDEIAKLTDNLKIQLQQLEEAKTTIQAPPWLLKA